MFRLAGRRELLEHLEVERRLDGAWHKQCLYAPSQQGGTIFWLPEEENVFVKLAVQPLP